MNLTNKNYNNDEVMSITLELMVNKKHLKRISEKKKLSSILEDVLDEEHIKSQEILDITYELFNDFSIDKYNDSIKMAFENYLHLCIEHINRTKSDLNHKNGIDSDNYNGYCDAKENNDIDENSDFSTDFSTEFEDEGSNYDELNNNDYKDDLHHHNNNESTYVPSNVKNCWGKSIKKYL
jgi:hypothetical protein